VASSAKAFGKTCHISFTYFSFGQMMTHFLKSSWTLSQVNNWFIIALPHVASLWTRQKKAAKIFDKRFIELGKELSVYGWFKIFFLVLAIKLIYSCGNKLLTAIKTKDLGNELTLHALLISTLSDCCPHSAQSLIIMQIWISAVVLGIYSVWKACLNL